MSKKNFYPMMMGAVVAAAVCLASFNAMADKDQQYDPYAIKTDASDRTLLKEILANQQIMIALLKEIKAAH